MAGLQRDSWEGAKTLSSARRRRYNAGTMKSPLVLVYALVLASAAGTIGCDNATPIYVRTHGGYGGVGLADKRAWTARGGLTRPQAATDGDLSTIARTARQYDFVELTIDLKQMVLFQTVVIDHGRDEHGGGSRV